MPNSPDLIAEARRRLQKSAPCLADEQIENWLAFIEAHGGQLTLTFDGFCFAEYPRRPATHADSQ